MARMRLSRRAAVSLVALAIGVAGIPTITVTAASAVTSGSGPFLTPQIQAAYQSRVDQAILSHYQFPQPVMTGCAAHRGYLNYATAAIWLDQSVADANTKLAAVRIANVIGQVCDPSIDASRANLWLSTLMRPYFLFRANSTYFPGRMNTTAANNLLAQMWAYAAPYSKLTQAPDPWSIYDSENHDAQAESFNFLAAQAFKESPAYSGRIYNDGSTVAQQYQAWHDHWSRYFDTRAKQGLFIEVGSPKYHSYLLDAILNIYNFSDDPILRKKAGMVLDLDFADYAQQQLKGILGGAKSRSFPADSPNGLNDAMTSYAGLLFGPAANVQSKYVLPLATSGYYPPPVVQSLATDPVGRGSFAYVTRRPGAGNAGWDVNKDWHVSTTRSILDYVYVTPDYVMGTAELNPADTDIAPSSQDRWQGIIFNTGPGDRIYPQAAPSSADKTNNGFASVQHTNVLITSKQKYLTQPTLVYFPSTLTALDEQSGWLFAKDGSAYVAVRPATGTYHWLTTAKNKASDITQRFIALSDVSSPIIFEATRASQYAGFDAFKARITANARTYSGGVLHYTSGFGTKFTFSGIAATPSVNGTPIDYSPTAVFNSPFMQSGWNTGQITITKGTLSAGYDFSDPANPVKVVN